MHPFNAQLQSAWEHLESGELHQARTLLVGLVEAAPQNDEAWHLLGVVESRDSRWESAERAFANAVSIQPTNGVWLNSLGLAQLNTFRISQSVTTLRAAVSLAPTHVAASYNLGLAYQEQGDLEASARQYQRTIELAPEHTRAWNNLGLVYSQQKQFESAIDCFEHALYIQSDYTTALNNLGLALDSLQRYERAQQCYRRALHFSPQDPVLLMNLGLSLLSYQCASEATECFGELVRLAPTDLNARCKLGCAQSESGDLELAKSTLQEILQIEPNHPEALLELGKVALYQGQFQDAEEYFRSTADHTALSAVALYFLSTLGGCALTREDELQLTRLCTDDQLPDSQRACAHFGLANALDHRQEYDAAFEHFRLANQLKNDHFDDRTELKMVEEIYSAVPQSPPSTLHRCKTSPSQLIFVVGLPRSGTTLVEQIIARHPQAYGCGEISIFAKLAKWIPQMVGNQQPWYMSYGALSNAQLKELRSEFFRQVPDAAWKHDVVIDKTPRNYLYLGLIEKLFPECRVIHCQRHLLDTALSCFFQNFASQPWTNDLNHIASYILGYLRLMRRWRESLAIPIDDIQYEDLVSNQTETTQRLLLGCNLSWCDDCLEFHQNPRDIQTLSVWQVRQPIYQSSVGRWKHYARHLESLRTTLGIME